MPVLIWIQTACKVYIQQMTKVTAVAPLSEMGWYDDKTNSDVCTHLMARLLPQSSKQNNPVKQDL